MQKLMLVGTLVGLFSGTATAQCCGDCDGSGRVAIEEVVAAVNNALNECSVPPTATPTATITPTPPNTPTRTRTPTRTPTSPPHCPFTFADNGAGLCSFQGRFNLGCGNSLPAAFSSNGQLLLIRIATLLSSPTTVSFSANITSPTTASLTAWSSNDFQTVRTTSGSVQLTNNGQQLVIFPNDPPFMIQSCNFVQYNGTFVASARLRQAGEADATAGFDRLEAWGKRVPPELTDSE